MVLYALASVALMVPFGLLVATLEGDGSSPRFPSWLGSLGWLAGNVALLLAALLVLKLVDRRPVQMLGLGLGMGWARELLVGLAAGLMITGGLVVVLVVGGSVELAMAPEPGRSLAALPLLVWIFALAATLEELVFRGYLLQAMAEGTRPWIAGLVTSLLFTWAHIDNPDVTAIGVLNIFLAGATLAVLYFRTRRLWLPIAFHLSWNICQSWLWGFDVSGITIEDRLLVMRPVGSEPLTGGGFGLEGSVLTTAVFVVLLLWLLLSRAVRPTSQVALLWGRYPTGFGAPPPTHGEAADDFERSDSAAV
jgi:hypothetical protein